MHFYDCKFYYMKKIYRFFFWGGVEVIISDGKASACNAGDPISVLSLGRSLKKEMATHSSILAWRIPRTKELGKLQSVALQRVGQD